MSKSLTAEQQKYIQKNFKIPVDNRFPQTFWIISLDIESKMPTDEELRQLQSYCEFKARDLYLYRSDKILIMELPKDVGHHTMIFRKGEFPDGNGEGWFYRKLMWRIGPTFIPYHLAENYKLNTLIELLNGYENITPEKWQAWRKNHPDIFPVFLT